MRRKLPVCVVALLLIAVTGSGVRFWQTKWPPSVKIAGVEKNLPVRFFKLRTAKARVIARAGFKVGAAIMELHADQGNNLAKGDVLARIGDK